MEKKEVCMCTMANLRNISNFKVTVYIVSEIHIYIYLRNYVHCHLEIYIYIYMYVKGAGVFSCNLPPALLEE